MSIIFHFGATFIKVKVTPVFHSTRLIPIFSDAPIDLKVKSALICDLFNLISIPPVNIYQYLNNESKQVCQPQMKNEEMLIIKRLEEEKTRCGCFIRIYPCEEMFDYFSNYFSDEKLHLNEIIHQYFYPNRWKKSSSNNFIHQRKSIHRNHLQRCKYLSTIFHLFEKNSSIAKNSPELTSAIERYHSYHKTSFQSNVIHPNKVCFTEGFQ